MKSIETLVPDIEALFVRGCSLDPSALSDFSKGLSKHFGERFVGYGEERAKRLSLSQIGRPLRQLWFELVSGLKGESIPPQAKLKFLYGDVLEDLLLLLAKEAGHIVEDQQKEVEIDGVRGSIDCVIDGVLIDIKSASSFSYAKFKDGTIFSQDPFGYVAQLAGYSLALGGIRAGWVVVDKTLGHIQFVELPEEEIEKYDVRGRIRTVREVLSSPEMPPCCCSPVPDGKSGNQKLPVQGSYCAWKKHCYPELRTFLYSNGPTYLTHVERIPNVFEVQDV